MVVNVTSSLCLLFAVSHEWHEMILGRGLPPAFTIISGVIGILWACERLYHKFEANRIKRDLLRQELKAAQLENYRKQSQAVYGAVTEPDDKEPGPE